jgi:tRNA pseudouridine55 synthase
VRSRTIPRRPAVVHGLCVVDKPAGMTSHDAVAAVRRTLGERRVGHAGTLDPDATGVLLVGVGSVTRLLRFLTALAKTYTAEVVLGVETDTLDAAGRVTARHEMGDVGVDDARRVVRAHLTGEIEQVPPMVSAVRVGGRRLHEWARQGVDVTRPPRPVRVHRFDVEPADAPGVLRITVTCSSGTYVRVLAADLGRLLGGGAHLRNLRRTAVGSFTEEEATPLGALALLVPSDALRDYPSVAVDDVTAAAVSHGGVLDAFDAGDGPWAVVDAGGSLLAVYERVGPRAKPAVVVSGR